MSLNTLAVFHRCIVESNLTGLVQQFQCRGLHEAAGSRVFRLAHYGLRPHHHQKHLHEALPKEDGNNHQGTPASGPCPLLAASIGQEMQTPEVPHHQVQEQLVSFSC